MSRGRPLEGWTADELRTRRSDLVDRHTGPPSLREKVVAAAQVFGLLLILGAVGRVLQSGLDAFSVAAILLGGPLVYSWHKADRLRRLETELIADINAELARRGR